MKFKIAKAVALSMVLMSSSSGIVNANEINNDVINNVADDNSAETETVQNDTDDSVSNDDDSDLALYDTDENEDVNYIVIETEENDIDDSVSSVDSGSALYDVGENEDDDPTETAQNGNDEIADDDPAETAQNGNDEIADDDPANTETVQDGNGEDVIASGECGENVTYTLTSDGTLTISGTGSMTDFRRTDVPWYNYISIIKNIVIEDGVTSIGDSAFLGCSALTSVTIPKSITSIGNFAFYNCTGLTTVNYGGSILDFAKINTNSYIPGTAEIICGENADDIKGSCGEDVSYTLDDKGHLTISGTGDMTNFENYNDIPWYDYRSFIKEAVIENGVTSIGDNAFNSHYSLTSVSVPDSVTSIGNNAFRSCDSLTSISVPEGVTSIGNSAFSGCRSLTSTSIPESVTSIGTLAFSGCNSLTDIYYAGSKSKWNIITLLSDLSIPENVQMHYEKEDSGEAEVIDEGECGENLTYTFTSDKTLTISGTGDMTGFGFNYDFPWYKYSSYIENVVINNGVTSITNNAFNGYSSLTSISIPESVTSIGFKAFNSDSLTDIYYAGNKTKWNLISFDSNYTIPETVEIHYDKPDAIEVVEEGKLGENLTYTFTSDNTLTISGTGDMTDFEFYNKTPWYKYHSSINEVVIESGVTSIGSSAFYDCRSLTSVTIPEGVISIGSDAFNSCDNLTTVSIPEGVTSIGNAAFMYCSSLTTVSIPESVTSIEDAAFSGCSSLETVYFAGSKIDFESMGSGHDIPKTAEIIYGKKVTITGDWGEDISYTLDDAGLLTISGTGKMPDCNYPENAPWFDHGWTIKKAIIESGVTSVGELAFNRCTTLTTVSIPESVTSIGSSAFNRCTTLTTVSIPESVTSIGSFAFSECSSLTDINYEESLSKWLSISIGNNAFPEKVNINFGKEDASEVIKSGECGTNTTYTFTSDKTLTISGTGDMDLLGIIGQPWSKYRSYIEKAVIESGVTSIGDAAFSGCSNLVSVLIPESVTSIASSAFSGCSSLTSLIIPESISASKISNSAFNGCSNLKITRYCSTTDDALNLTDVKVDNIQVVDDSVSITKTAEQKFDVSVDISKFGGSDEDALYLENIKVVINTGKTEKDYMLSKFVYDEDKSHIIFHVELLGNTDLSNVKARGKVTAKNSEGDTTEQYFATPALKLA